MGMENFNLDTVFFDNTVFKYLIALGMLVLLTIVFRIVSKVLVAVLDKLSMKTTNQAVALLMRADKKLMPIVWYLPVYIASRYLTLPDKVKNFIGIIGLLIVTFCVVRYAVDVVKVAVSEYVRRNGGSPMLSHSAGIIANIVLWAMALLFLLSNFGFNVTTLLTGLGIGGMAIALASQTLLGDLFNYFTIIIDQPFTIGDTVKVGGVTGTIKSIGLKGTRLTSTTGEQVVMSNTDMTKSVLLNFNVMNKRKVTTKIGIKYDTPAEKAKEIPSVVRHIVEAAPDTEFGRAHFYEFGDSSLNYEIVYFIMDKDYDMYMDRLQQVNFAILDEFTKMGVEFAFPSHSIYMEK